MSQPIVQPHDIDTFINRELSQFLCCAYALGNADMIAAARAHRSALAARDRRRAGETGSGWPDERQIRSAIDAAVTRSSENSKLLLEFFGEMAGALCGLGRATALPGLPRLQAAGRAGEPALEAEIARRKDAEAQLDRLIAHQECMVEEERKRIARELHDELGSLLAGIGAHLSAAVRRAQLDGSQPAPELLAASRLADSAAQVVRRVVTDLRPSVLDHLGIWSSLEWYAGHVQERTALACECSIAPELHEVEPDPGCGTALFRIVQEACTNVARHANASRVAIRARREGGDAVVEIEDDGCGIETGRLLQRDSFGIAGMHERARQFGAEVRIAAAREQGTVVSLRFKLPAGPAAMPGNQEG